MNWWLEEMTNVDDGVDREVCTVMSTRMLFYQSY